MAVKSNTVVDAKNTCTADLATKTASLTTCTTEKTALDTAVKLANADAKVQKAAADKCVSTQPWYATAPLSLVSVVLGGLMPALAAQVGSLLFH